jgi:hypothetical protein
LQLSEVQTLLSLQLSGVPAVQVPLWQVSAPLHTVLSGQAVPFVTATFWQPVVALQLSVVHTLLSLQLSGVPAVHVPFWQVSEPLQTVASRQGVPFRRGVLLHPKSGSQESVVQTLLSLQLSAVPAVQVPVWHTSAPLQALPSEHDVPLATFVTVHPVAGLQPFVVQRLLSVQVSAVPAVQVPL